MLFRSFLAFMLAMVSAVPANCADDLQRDGPIGYLVVVQETSSPVVARDLAAKARTDGYSTVLVTENAGQLRVALGPFPLYIDAYVARLMCGGKPNDKGLTVTEAAARASCSSVEAIRALPRPLLGIAAHETSAMLWSNRTRFAADEAKAVIDRKQVEPETSKGVALLSVADQHVKSGQRAAALPLQLAVARSEVPAEDAIRVQACWDAARSFHALGKRVEAYRAYTELEASTSNRILALSCARERVGLVMELAQCAKGNMRDVRTLADVVLQTEALGPERRPEIACNVELMRAESFAKEGDWATAERELMAFAERWGKYDRTYIRELTTAMNWRGESLLKLKQTDAAIKVFESVIRLGMSPERNFARHNQDAIAAYFLVCAYRDKGDVEGMKAWTGFLGQNHHEWSEAKAAKEILDKYTRERMK